MNSEDKQGKIPPSILKLHGNDSYFFVTHDVPTILPPHCFNGNIYSMACYVSEFSCIECNLVACPPFLHTSWNCGYEASTVYFASLLPYCL